MAPSSMYDDYHGDPKDQKTRLDAFIGSLSTEMRQALSRFINADVAERGDMLAQLHPQEVDMIEVFIKISNSRR